MKKICCLTLVCLWFGFIKGTMPTGISPDVLIYKDWKCLVRMAGFNRILYPVRDGGMLLLPDSLRSEHMWYPQYGEYGYKCVWELRNDSLFLTKIYAEKEVPLNHIYPDKDTSRGVFADWFSKPLIACTGDGMPMLVADFKNGKVNRNKYKPIYPSGPTELAGDWESISSGDSIYAVRIRKISSENYEGEILFPQTKQSAPEGYAMHLYGRIPIHVVVCHLPRSSVQKQPPLRFHKPAHRRAYEAANLAQGQHTMPESAG